MNWPLKNASLEGEEDAVAEVAELDAADRGARGRVLLPGDPEAARAVALDRRALRVRRAGHRQDRRRRHRARALREDRDLDRRRDVHARARAELRPRDEDVRAAERDRRLVLELLPRIVGDLEVGPG